MVSSGKCSYLNSGLVSAILCSMYPAFFCAVVGFLALGHVGYALGFVGLLGLENLLPTSIAFEYLFVNFLPSVPGLWQLGQLLVFVGVSLARHIVLVLAM